MILRFGREYDPLMVETYYPIYYSTIMLIALYWFPHVLTDYAFLYGKFGDPKKMEKTFQAYQHFGYFFTEFKLPLALHIYIYVFLIHTFFRHSYFLKMLPTILYCNTFIWTMAVLSWRY